MDKVCGRDESILPQAHDEECKSFMNETLIWSIIAIIGIANIYMGRAIAIWGLPHGVVEPPSRQMLTLFGLIEIAGMSIFLWDQRAQVPSFDFSHALLLALCVLFSYVFYRGRYAGHSKIRWDEHLNKKIHIILEICKKHGWDITSPEAVMRLANAGSIQFDEGDYDYLVEMKTDLEYKLSKIIERIPMLSDGQPDYNRTCAIEIFDLTNALAGFGESKGVVANVAQENDMTNFDWQGFERMKWLAKGIEQQWGLESLYK